MRLLIIDTIFEKESLHYDEFVRPILDIIKHQNIDLRILHWAENVIDEALYWSEKIIITGTSLKDNKFIEEIELFKWILTYEKPLLGICAGGQIISKLFGGDIMKGTEIGLKKNIEILNENELLLKDVELNEVYELHNYYFSVPEKFEIICKNEFPQIIKKKNIYAILFHPEVRNKKIIENFILKI